MLTNHLCNYVDAAFAGIWIETFEPDEAIKEIDALCRAESWHYAVWDTEQGLQHNGGYQKVDPLSVVQRLGSLANGETPILLVLRNYHQFIGNIDIIQAVERQITQGKSRRAFIVVLAPIVHIPVELEKLFQVLGSSACLTSPGFDASRRSTLISTSWKSSVTFDYRRCSNGPNGSRTCSCFLHISQRLTV
jgi:hypothetical protein